MDHELVIKYISTLGFPICVAAGMCYVLYKILNFLAAAHVKKIENDEAELIKQTAVLDKHLPAHTVMLDNILNELELTRREQEGQTEFLKLIPDICKHEADCENYVPRQKPKPKHD